MVSDTHLQYIYIKGFFTTIIIIPIIIIIVAPVILRPMIAFPWVQTIYINYVILAKVSAHHLQLKCIWVAISKIQKR